MTVDDGVIRALAIGPESSRAERTIDITTIGRRSGMQRRVEVWFHRVDGHWYITGMPSHPRSWYANLRADPSVVGHLKHGVTADLPATAATVDDLTRQHVIDAVLGLQGQTGLAVGVPRQDRDEWLAHAPLIEIVFDDEQVRAFQADETEGTEA
jgi:hypothetical protein